MSVVHWSGQLTSEETSCPQDLRNGQVDVLACNLLDFKAEIRYLRFLMVTEDNEEISHFPEQKK